MTSRRYFLLAAGALLVAHATVLKWLGDARSGPLLSDTIQLLLGITTFVASLRAMRRSQTLGRLFWKLSATAFFLWCAGQAFGAYYGSYLNLPTRNLWFVDIFYMAWPAPLVMCLFLDSEEEPEGADRRRLLDFGQVALVFVLLFFYFSALSAQDSSWSAYGLSAATDGLMTAAFFARAFSMRGAPERKLFLGIGLFRAVALLTDLYFVAGFPEQGNGTWFDLVWSMPWLIPLVTATCWEDGKETEPSPAGAKRRRPRMLLTHVLPLVFPVLVVVMAASVAPTQLKIAALAVLLSLGISYARLLLTHDALRRSTEALRNQHEMLHAIVEGTTAAIYVKDLQGRYQLMNSAGVMLVGKRLEEIVGKKDSQLFSPESASELMARDQEMLRSGLVSTYEEEISRGDVTRTFLTTKGPLRDAQGRVAGIVGSSLDITERYRAIEALAESEERFRTIFDGSPIGMAVISTDGRIVASNLACRQMLSLKEEDMAGVDIFDELTHPDDRAGDAERFQQLIHGEIEYDRREKRYILRDGRRVFADLHLYLVRDKKGAACYLIGIAVDISERKSLETQLRQAQRMETIGRLAGGVAHDFNNLLMVIKGYCDLLIERGGNADGMPQLERIGKAADQAASLTQQLLAFSRKQVMQPKVFNLNTLVWNAEKMLSRLISENVEMVTVTAKNLGTIKADPGQIEQVILNLVINARDAMPNGGTLTLETANIELDESYAQGHLGAVPGSYVMLAVTDNGLGMDDETQARIFEPFFTTKELGKGTGLGLSMVYGIVKQSGGYIWVYSEPGKGSTFKVYLPRVAEQVEESAPAPAPLKDQRGTETILLVEDEEAVRDLIVTILSQRGYEVIVARHPEHAEEIATKFPHEIHLLLTDVVMPGTSGRELAARIGARRPGIRVLYMSGYTENVITSGGMLEKGLAFLQKPFSPVALSQKVREVLSHTPAL